MPVNSDKPHLWKSDVAQSVDFYNAWFIQFAPQAYREQRTKQTQVVEKALQDTDYIRNISPGLLTDHPDVLPMLRMATAPPLARDRLIGLAYLSPNLVYTMEGRGGKPSRIPPRMDKTQLAEEFTRIGQIIYELADRDIFPWLSTTEEPTPEESHRAATILADRLCGAAADPIIRNAQERRQLAALKDWLEARKYVLLEPSEIPNIREMKPGTFTFFYNVPVQLGRRKVNITVDCMILPHLSEVGDFPLFIEAKSAGDFTNTNKRRKEEAQKANQLRTEYGPEIQFILFLCGYFDTPYLGYEAAEGIDWVWEHRIDDLSGFGLDDSWLQKGHKSPDPPPQVGEPQTGYDVSSAEQRRLAFQKLLDEKKTQEERNRLGQFATPTDLAREIMVYAESLIPKTNTVNFLDPALGTGSFFSALRTIFPANRLGNCKGVEIDPHYGKPAQKLWNNDLIDIAIADFTKLSPPNCNSNRYNLIVCNPPYVRHHHLNAAQKKYLQERVSEIAQTTFSGLSGLYVYFLILAHEWMQEEGIAAWLIPTEFLYVNYGKHLRNYLLNRVTLLHIHRFNPSEVQFADAMVSSAVVWLKKQKPEPAHKVRFTSGGTLLNPTEQRWISTDELATKQKWNTMHLSKSTFSDKSEPTIGDLFFIKRGIATGANRFFIFSEKEIQDHNLSQKYFKPILPSPRYLTEKVIESNPDGMPLIEKRLFLLSCTHQEEQIVNTDPELWAYLQEGIRQGIPERYLCKHRSPWYLQEERLPAPFLCSYMGRGISKNSKPFRFFLNHSKALVTNVYLNLYPRPFLQEKLKKHPTLTHKIWHCLDSLTSIQLIGNGRTYGGGLHKLEPKELANMPIGGFLSSLAEHPTPQLEMF